MDPGTENGLVGTMQIAFRINGTDPHAGDKSIKYGSSPTNQVELYTKHFHCQSTITSLLYTFIAYRMLVVASETAQD